MGQIYLRLRDHGCIGALRPVIEQLLDSGVSLLHVLLDQESVAWNELSSFLADLEVKFSLTESVELDPESTFVTCLPLEAGHDLVLRQRERIERLILIQEVPEYAVRGNRTSDWLECEPDVVCTMSESVSGAIVGLGHNAIATGLPAIDTAAKSVRVVDAQQIIHSRGFGDRDQFMVVSFPGDLDACSAMLDVVKPVVNHAKSDLVLVATFHPKFQRDDPVGYEQFVGRVRDLSCRQIEIGSLGFFEALALGASERGHFVAPSDSTMPWQLSVSGGKNVWIAVDPEDSALQSQICQEPFLGGSHGRILIGLGDFLADREPVTCVQSDGTAAEAIAREIQGI